MEIKLWHFFAHCFKKHWLAITIFFLGIINLLLPIDSFERAKNLVILRPNNSFAHLELSLAAAQALDWKLARSEFERASSLLNSNKGSQVFGISSRFEEVQARVYQEQTIHEEINLLRKVLENCPSYRDVYLRISLLYYQLSDDAAAYSFWNTAQELDPNHEEVIKVGELLRKLE